jgi:hypothetical protein
VTAVVLVVSTTGSAHEASAGGRPVEDVPGWAPEITQPFLPDPGPHRKLVGFRTLLLAVPSAWKQSPGPCAAVTANAVVFPTEPGQRLCDDGSVPRGLSTVSFSVDTAGEPEVQGDYGPRMAQAGRLVVTRPAHQGGRYVAYTSAPELGVGISVTTRSRAALERIIRSITVLPVGYTTVPELIGLPSGRAETATMAHRLVIDPRFRPGFVPVPMAVVGQSQPVGAVVPSGSHLTVRLEPRMFRGPSPAGR